MWFSVREKSVQEGQPVQQVDDVGLGRHASLKGELYGREHDLLIVLEDQGQNLADKQDGDSDRGE